jgi:Ca2+-binding EF-hand superfamily protein
LEQRPNPDKLQGSCVEEGAKFESVIGDRLKLNGTFREIVVFNDDHVYPEYIIKYERIFFHERFAEIYGQMLQRRNRGQFNGPTPDELQVMQSMWNVFAMPNKGRINKWQLLDLLIALFQPPKDEGADLDDTFNAFDTKQDGVIDWEEFFQEICQRVKDGVPNSGPQYFAQMYRQMLSRQKRGQFNGPTAEETQVLRTVWYQYAKNSRTIDKWQLLELLKAINQPPENEGPDLDATFQEWDTKQDGVIDDEEFMQEMMQRIKDGIEC